MDKLEKIQRDLAELKMESEIQYSTVLSKLEQKLPYLVRRDWIVKVSDKIYDSKAPKEIFTEFMEFLKQTKKQVEYDNSESRAIVSHNKTKTFKSFTMGELETKSSSGSVGTSREPSRKAEIVPCLGCNDGKTDLKCTLHKMSECEVFKLTPLKELLSRVKCRKCPYATDGHIYSDCKRSMKCHHCKEADHHALLCSKKRQHKSKTNASHTKVNFIENVAADGLNPVMCQAQFFVRMDHTTRN